MRASVIMIQTLSSPKRFGRLFSPLRRTLALALIASAIAGSASAGDFVYTVREGDNPWSLTERFLKSFSHWPRLQAYNHIVDARALRPGSTLRIPAAWLRANEATARVLDARGEVQAIGSSGTIKVVAGTALPSGTLIRTGDASSVIIEFPDGSRSQLGAQGALRLNAVREVIASGAQQVELQLDQGRIESSVASTSRAGGGYSVRTPAAVAAVRGTEFRISVDEASDVRTETLEGRVDVGNARGRVRLPAGTGTLASTGQRPLAASALLPAPALDELPQQIDRIPFRHALPQVPGAVAYRTQLLASSGIVDAEALSARAEVLANAAIADGSYRLRVRAIDANGIEGEDAEREIILNARPEPPFLTAPTPGARVSDEEIRFAWARSTEAAHDHFQLAADADFRTLIEDRAELEGASVKLDSELAPGRYFWRVARSTAGDGKGPFSDVQAFERPPPGPQVEAPELDGKTLSLRWRSGGDGERYQLQLARSEDFAAPTVDVETDGPQVEMPMPAPGSYYLRVRSLPAELSPGPWGKPQQIDVSENPWYGLMIFAPLLLLGL